jgi:hypothetical protein
MHRPNRCRRRLRHTKSQAGVRAAADAQAQIVTRGDLLCLRTALWSDFARDDLQSRSLKLVVCRHNRLGYELAFRNAMIFARTVASLTPLNGFMLLLGTTASGFVMNLSSVISSQMIPELFKPCE